MNISTKRNSLNQQYKRKRNIFLIYFIDCFPRSETFESDKETRLLQWKLNLRDRDVWLAWSNSSLFCTWICRALAVKQVILSGHFLHWKDFHGHFPETADQRPLSQPCKDTNNLNSQKQMILTLWTSAAAAAAKSLQSCPTLCDPRDGSPPGSPIPGILQARTLEWVAISFSNAWKWKVKVKSLSRVWVFATPWTAAYQAPQSMGFFRQEYWSGVLLPSLLNLRRTLKMFLVPCVGSLGTWQLECSVKYYWGHFSL